MILSIDVGTTSIKCSAINDDYEVVSSASTKAILEHPKKGWVEKDPDLLWESIATTVSKLDLKQVSAIVFSAHMAGVLPVDREGNPLRKIITWLDERAAGLPEDVWSGALKLSGYSITKLIKFLRITGGAPSKTGKDPISKIVWIKENEPDVFSKTYKILGVNGYLIKRAADAYVINPDDAHLTWLADTRGGIKWCERLLKDYGIPKELLPEIKNSTDIAGKLTHEAARDLGLDAGIPVVVGAGDVCSTAVGSGAVRDRELHVYIGTSDWVAGHSEKRKTDVFHYIGSLTSAIPGKYLVIAEQEVAAGALEWVMKIGGVEGKYEEVEQLVSSTKPGKIFMPWMYGERCPIDDPHLRGGVINLSLDDGLGELLRSVMDGVALNLKWAYTYMEKIMGRQDAVNAVGGGTLFDVWCQIIADAINRPIKRMSKPQHAAVRGAAVIANVALGKDTFEGASRKFTVDKVFKPKNPEVYAKLFKIYVEVYKKLRGVYKKLSEI